MTFRLLIWVMKIKPKVTVFAAEMAMVLSCLPRLFGKLPKYKGYAF